MVEFMAHWIGDYSQEEIIAYNSIHGDDRLTWSATNSYAPVTIDIEKVVRFNSVSNVNDITVDLDGGNSITINISYNKFKDILSYFGINITSYIEDGIQNNNK